MGPCLCGDTHCPSCGPAQGNWRCPICRAWADDGCEHLTEDGNDIRPEFLDAARQAEADEEAYWKAYAEEMKEEK